MKESDMFTRVVGIAHASEIPVLRKNMIGVCFIVIKREKWRGNTTYF